MAIEIPGIINSTSHQPIASSISVIKNESKTLPYIKAGLTTLIGAAALTCLFSDYNEPLTGNNSTALILHQSKIAKLENVQNNPTLVTLRPLSYFIYPPAFTIPSSFTNLFKWMTPPPATPEIVLQITNITHLKTEPTVRFQPEEPPIFSNANLPRCALKSTTPSSQRFEGSAVGNSTCPIPLKEMHKLYSVSPIDSFVQGIHEYAVQNWKSIALWTTGLSLGLGATVYGTAVIIPAMIAGYNNQKKILASLLHLKSLIGENNAALIPAYAVESFGKVCELIPEGERRTEFFVGFLNAQADAFGSYNPADFVNRWLDEIYGILQGAQESDGLAEAYAAYQNQLYGYGPLEFNHESQPVFHWDGGGDVSTTTFQDS